MDSIAVENYLKSLWQLGPDNVATLDLAQHLDVTPASATKMIKRLTEKGLVEHIPYKGASLTKDGESKAIADQYGYKQEKYLFSYLRYFDFGTFNLSKSFTENEYEIADTFVLSSTVRDDELDTTSISLNGELVNLYFLNKFKFFEDIYYNLSFSKIDSTSNILNYNYEKEIHNIGLTKRINF